MQLRVLCTGTRDWTDEAAVRAAFASLDEYDFWEQPSDVTIVHGACPTGADAIVDRVARELGFQVERHPGDWDRYGLAAGPIRNSHMVSLGADLCFAFWDGRVTKSGTLDCFQKAVRAGIPVHIWPAKKHVAAP